MLQCNGIRCQTVCRLLSRVLQPLRLGNQKYSACGVRCCKKLQQAATAAAIQHVAVVFHQPLRPGPKHWWRWHIAVYSTHRIRTLQCSTSQQQELMTLRPEGMHPRDVTSARIETCKLLLHCISQSRLLTNTKPHIAQRTAHSAQRTAHTWMLQKRSLFTGQPWRWYGLTLVR